MGTSSNKNKLHRLSRVKGEAVPIDSLKRQSSDDRTRGAALLEEAHQHWMRMAKFREDRERAKRYNYGDQWKDLVDVGGCRMTEEDYIRSQGGVPLKNNLIRKLTRSVLGVYRQQSKEPICVARDRDEQELGEVMSTVLQYNGQLNRLNEVYARSLEELLISGLIVHRKHFGWRNNKLDVWTDYVPPAGFFIDSNAKDFRGWDVECIGQIHDISFSSMLQTFAKDKNDADRLSAIYQSVMDSSGVGFYGNSFGQRLDSSSRSFLYPMDSSLCRVIEMWRKETKPRWRCHDYNTGEIYKIELEDYGVMVQQVNEDRLARAAEQGIPADEVPLIEATWMVDSYWYYYFISPTGDILDEGETPYAHKEHPFVFKAYPFIDGEIHSFVSDIIDQQRYSNRLIMMHDWIMRSSAKGVLIVPEEGIGETMDINDIAEQWTRFNGVIAVKTKEGVPMPQQISANSTNIGISELLNLELKLLEDISGVQGALQGKPGFSGMSASLYSQQAQNATTSLVDILDTFGQFVTDAAYKDVKNIQQYYDTKRAINIAGRSGSYIEYDPEKTRDVEFDLSIVESTTTPAYRMAANDFLMELWRSGQVTIEQLLEHGDFPFSDQLLQSIKAQGEAIERGDTPEPIDPKLLDQVRALSDQGAVDRLHGAMYRPEDYEEDEEIPVE